MLSWLSLAWMSGEGAVGLFAGIAAGSIALVGWALSSAVAPDGVSCDLTAGTACPGARAYGARTGRGLGRRMRD